MQQALIKVAENVELNEPDTVRVFISQDDRILPFCHL